MAKKTYRKKSTANRAKRPGQRVYRVKRGWRISSRRHARRDGWARVGGRKRRRR